ncbi:TadE/TadG family type IV pilus assembly protein [Streptomyces tauricus]|uniref:TadE/TadG family type IV pilus assembly protein n=1 Tax=Streptomyces tauricus TaxID=68274 RepID=UPI002243D42C|nr:TadE/TadG family type IV pilus assembly protein [Streptomyces tauricus]MCW8101682.1 pilus assembly protein [Streptomyces tauricus]
MPTTRVRPWRRLAGRRWWREDRGATALDMSMVVPLAFLLVFTLIQGGVWFHGRSVAHRAAQQAVDAQRVYGAAPGAGEAAAGEFLTRMGGSLNGAAVRVSDDGETVSVFVEGNVINLVPGWSGHISQSVQAPVERFRP